MKTTLIKTSNPSASNKSKAHLKFEKLLAEIEQQQSFRKNLQEGLNKAYTKIDTEIAPLQKERNTIFREYIIRIDTLAEEIGLGKYNREYLENYMGDEIYELLDFFGHQDDVLSNLYEKYTHTSLKEIAQSDIITNTVNALSEVLGFKIDAKEFLEKGEKAYFEEHKQQILDHMNSKSESFKKNDDEAEKPGKNKKAPLQNETDDFAKSARNIYMRLIKKFHPDLEKDEAVINEKNEIIKSVTKAYQENDFFALLKLQVAYLDDNEAEAAVIADDMLKKYNKLLQKQLNELSAWVNETHFASGEIIADFIDKNGKFSPQKFAARKKNIEKNCNILKADMASSYKRPKGWFKEQITIIREEVRYGMMGEIFSDMFSNF